MKYMTSEEIITTWIEFWKSKGHAVEESANLIPNGDKTLLWINSGVAALKKYFDGSVTPKNRRIVNVQKAIRTNDIDNVGFTARHHTFFEMLGNFSIGDYFRNEVLPWAYELLTDEKWFGIPVEKLYFTTYIDDIDTQNLWKSLGVPADHIVPLEGNFWEIGEGPCGPDTEIFFDRGESWDKDNIGVDLIRKDIDNDRYIEIWNIVFSQFNAKEGVARKDYKELPYKNIDTGSGFERFCCILQGAETNFETDVFLPIIKEIEKNSKLPYEGEYKFYYRVIADHIRTCTFALTDGAMFSNEGRGYVLRRIIRRALRYAKKLGINDSFMYKLVPVVRDIMKSYYPTLVTRCDYVSELIKIEEDKFKTTLTSGENLLKEVIESTKGDTISGKDAFKLYDTYGFPIELTIEIAGESNKKVNMDEFKTELEEQKNRARNARKEEASMKGQFKDLLDCKVESEFNYESTSLTSTVVSLFKNGSTVNEIVDEGEIIVDNTCFYAEMGGQVADKGVIKSSSFEATVTNVTKAPNGQHLHFVKVSNGSIKLGDTVTLTIDVARRNAIRKHHSAAHLLQRALKEVLGDHIAQAGSYVDDTKTRFDFNHFKKISSEELELIEKKVNDAILASYPVVTQVMNIEDAKKTNAVALFDDKYQDLIRVVNMGDYSIEFCGGTHVSNTNDIGLFVIRSEESISSGVRRIEACCGIKGYELLKEREGLLKNVATNLRSASIYDVNEKLTATLNELNKQKVEISELKEKVAGYELNALLNNVKVIDGVNVIINKVNNLSAGELNVIASGVKNKYPDHFLFIVSKNDDKLSMICQLTDKVINKGIFAGDIVKNASMLASGNGGGRKDFAQAGAKDISKIDDIINYVNNTIGA